MRVAAVSLDDRAIEDVVDPATVAGGRYPAPATPGSSTPMRAGALTRYAYPEGSAWQ
ncbi:hypothetical protein Acy02nite_49350 [Actinoplanes cyaneus]|uniref:Uncharacterized protein n=1 Tax=Actinoplanes cyaneus TaxID=52696 RepID=A0A919M913_9ACTN|nr:hypothetical protein [Actinoplanes cyaneus]MCW2140993.1 hypothetical protein [Actinoplanes cyaneus]GID67054.1 hypothetical protein Acy02nite_49350 [Actinoplanes cyaneus]